MEIVTLTFALTMYAGFAVALIASVWAWALSARDDARLAEGMRVAASDHTRIARCRASARLLRYYTWAANADVLASKSRARFTGLRAAPGADTVPGVASYAPGDLVPTAVGA